MCVVNKTKNKRILNERLSKKNDKVLITIIIKVAKDENIDQPIKSANKKKVTKAIVHRW